MTVKRNETLEYTVTYEAVWSDDFDDFGIDLDSDLDSGWVISGSVDSDGERWFHPDAQTGQDDPIPVGWALLPADASPDFVAGRWVNAIYSDTEDEQFGEF